MAKVKIDNISKLCWVIVDVERTFDHHTLHPKVTEMYLRKGYDQAPLSSDEAKSHGLSRFNGFVSSFPSIRRYSESNGSSIVIADMMPTRYLVGQACRDIFKEDGITEEGKIRELSPDMAHVALIVPSEYNGKKVLIAQLKGKGLGEGEIIAPAACGNIDAKFLKKKDPFKSALEQECLEEIGISLSDLETSKPAFFMDDSETAEVSFAYVAKKIDLLKIIEAYRKSVETTLLSELEVRGLALLPIEYSHSEAFDEVMIIQPTENRKFEWSIEKRGLRPYTLGLIDFLKDKEKRKSFLENCGF